jgi:four helix bundle protein
MARTRSRRFPSFASTAGSRGEREGLANEHLRSFLDLDVDLDLVVDLDLDLVLDFDFVLVQGLHCSHPMNYRNLEVYQLAVRFLPLAAEIAGALPRKHHGLADQIRRASVSIPLNIAEGSGKTSGPDQRRFYAIARGSAMECGAIVDACAALNLIGTDRAADANELLGSVVRMLSKMCKE